MTRAAVAFLAGSPDRLALLDYLAEQPGAPRDVADALDISSRSAQRNCAEFTERGWAEKREGDYHLTTRGHLVRRTYADCLDRLERIDDLAGFYDYVSDPGDVTGPDTVPDPSWLDEATLVTTEQSHPQAPVTHYVDAIRTLDAEEVRMVSPVLSRIFERPHAELVRRGATTELVLPTDRVAAAREQNPAKFATVLAVPSFTLYETDDAVEFGVTVVDDRTFVLAYDTDGRVRACLDGSDADLTSWALDRFERLRERATELEHTGLF